MPKHTIEPNKIARVDKGQQVWDGSLEMKTNSAYTGGRSIRIGNHAVVSGEDEIACLKCGETLEIPDIITDWGSDEVIARFKLYLFGEMRHMGCEPSGDVLSVNNITDPSTVNADHNMVNYTSTKTISNSNQIDGNRKI